MRFVDMDKDACTYNQMQTLLSRHGPLPGNSNHGALMPCYPMTYC